MKANAAQMRAYVDAPDPAIRLVLLHGPDSSGAAELAAQMARGLGDGVDKLDFDIKDLKSGPGLIADEASSLSLFGDKRLLRIFNVDDSALEALSLLLDAERTENPVVAIGPTLKTSSKLVKLAIGSPRALAHGCYVPEGQNAVRLAAAIAREHGLRLTGEVPQRLAAAAGGDRAVLTREIEKLALYLDAAPDRPRDADAGALLAVGTDLDEVELYGVIEAVIDGRTGAVGTELAQLFESGGGGIPLLRQLARRLIALADLRAQIDAGASAEQVLDRIFFRERDATARAIRRWSAAQLARAVERVRETERALMRGSGAGDILAEAECTAIARAAARLR